LIRNGQSAGLNFSRLNIDKRTQDRERETTLKTESNEARARAEASFRKEERAKEGAKAMMEYQANSRMVREKTERLKALRLAKEAAGKECTDCHGLKNEQIERRRT
jgi:hypothetical protein